MVTYQAAEHIGRQDATKPSHLHDWVIAPPHGSPGPWVCRHCGVRRGFMDSVEYSPTNIEDDTLSVLSFLVDLAKIGILFGLGRFLSSLLSCG